MLYPYYFSYGPSPFTMYPVYPMVQYPAPMPIFIPNTPFSEPAAIPLDPARLTNTMDLGISPIPSITSIFFAPSSFKAAAAARKEAIAQNNKEALVDANMRLALTPSSVLYALTAMGLLLINAFSTAKISHPALIPIFAVLSPIALGAGMLVCLTGGLFEVVAAIRQIRFLNKISLKHQNAEDALQFIKNRFFSPISKIPLESRMKDLARRIDYQTVIELKALVEESSPCPLCLEQELEIAVKQAKKKLIIHFIGLAAILVAASGLLISFLSLCPPLIILTFIACALILAVARAALMKGWLPSEDWSFSLQKAFPFLFVRDRVSASLTNTGLSLTNLLALG